MIVFVGVFVSPCILPYLALDVYQIENQIDRGTAKGRVGAGALWGYRRGVLFTAYDVRGM